jgi:hypothetical protein
MVVTTTTSLNHRLSSSCSRLLLINSLLINRSKRLVGAFDLEQEACRAMMMVPPAG